MTKLTHLSLHEVVAACQHERHVFRSQGDPSSPACLEVFRRAFVGDQDAWTAIYVTFNGLMRGWIGVQRVLDPEEVTQEAFRAFAQHAPQTLNLEMHGRLAPVLAYLHRCTKTAILRLLRQLQASQQLQEQFHSVEIEQIDDCVSHQNLDEDTTTRLVLRERLAVLLLTDDEHLVCSECLVNGRKPAELAALHPERFADVKAVYTIEQRIIRRFHKDPAIRELVNMPPEQRQKTGPTRSHAVEAERSQAGKQHSKKDYAQISPIEMLGQAEGSNDVNRSCHLDEEQLLDYVLGTASLELCRQVEETAACRQAAQQLALDILPLMAWLRRLECPAAENLVAYHEQQLDSTTQLVIHRHVAGCPDCQAECQLLDQISALALEGQPGPLRRLVEAIFQSPLALPQALRGELLVFTAPTITIHLSTRISRGQPRSWILRGQARTSDGLQAQAMLEAVELYPLDLPEEPGQPGHLEQQGSFVFRDLPAGSYRLHVLTSDEEIVIRRIIIGHDQ